MKTLPELVAGDLVVVHQMHHIDCVLAIDRVTATKIVVGETGFRRKDGHTVGQYMHFSPWITVPREGEIEKVRERGRIHKLIQKLSAVQWKDFSVETLDKVAALLGAK